MRRLLLIGCLALLLPAGAFAERLPASSLAAGRSFVVSSPSSGNAYDLGASVIATAPVPGDLSAIGGSVISAGQVGGDALLLGGTVSVRGSVGGDVRALAGTVKSEAPVGGDFSAFGFSVADAGRPQGSVLIVAADVTLGKGAVGPVTIYGNNVSLAGNFGSDVTVVVAGRLTLAASTTIRGTLSYQAPEPAAIPASAAIGAVEYSSASYLPDAGTSRFLAFLGIGLFLFVRILGALILAGLLAGLFPRLAEAVVERAFARRVSSVLLTILLGFGILVAAPVLMLLLALTFVGIGLALLLFVLYALVALLGVLYAGIMLGGTIARRFFHRETILWRDGVIGMFVLSLVSLVPVVGLVADFVLITFATGALLQIFFNFAFPRERPDLVY